MDGRKVYFEAMRTGQSWSKGHRSRQGEELWSTFPSGISGYKEIRERNGNLELDSFIQQLLFGDLSAGWHPGYLTMILL